MYTSMTLKILLPHQVLMEVDSVKRIILETADSTYGLLPNRLDCVAALSQGILTYEQENSGDMYVAVDEGMLVKTGNTVTVAVKNAFASADLGKLEELAASEFQKMTEREKRVKVVLSKLESEFVRRYSETRHE